MSRVARLALAALGVALLLGYHASATPADATSDILQGVTPVNQFQQGIPGNGGVACGESSIAVILNYYLQQANRPSVTLGQVYPLVNQSKHGTYPADIVNGVGDASASPTIGLPYELVARQVEVRRSEWAAVVEQEIAAQRPLIAFVPDYTYLRDNGRSGGTGHWIVIGGIDGRDIVYYDSIRGRRMEMARPDFEKALKPTWPEDSEQKALLILVEPSLAAPSDFSVGLATRNGFGYHLNVRWTDRSADEDGFQVYYRPEGGPATPWFTAPANSFGANRDGMVFDADVPSQYGVCYWIVATRGGLQSNPSNESCLKKWEDDDIDAGPPDGAWIEAPLTGSTIESDVLRLGARAYPADGPAIERVEFTLWWPDVGPANGPWRLGCSLREAVIDELFRCDIDLGSVPAGEFRISFDVYDVSGRYTLAPDGTRQLVRSRSDSPPPDRGGGNDDPDSDGIRGSSDRCPTQPEDQNGYEDGDGCPEGGNPDPDRDGIRGSNDQCPTLPEDLNGYQDADGCPEGGNPDPDGDGIRGSSDRCPTLPETVNGYQDGDGCPDEAPVEYDFSFDLMDWPDGVTFQVGDDIGFCYSLSPSNVAFSIEVFKSSNGGPYEYITAWTDTGGGDCVWVGTVGGPEGQRTYLARVSVNGVAVAEDTAFIYVSQPSSCDRPPSQPWPIWLLGGNLVTWDVSDEGGDGCSLTFEIAALGGLTVYQGSGWTAYLPDISCGAAYFFGARNERGESGYSLWEAPCQ